MRIPTNNDKPASTQAGDRTSRNGRKCPRCKKFGTFAPHAIVCDRCLGTLPLVFDVSVTVIVGGDQ